MLYSTAVNNLGEMIHVLILIISLCLGVGETGVGWDKFWLGQCPSVPNEAPYGDTNVVFGEP